MIEPELFNIPRVNLKIALQVLYKKTYLVIWSAIFLPWNFLRSTGFASTLHTWIPVMETIKNHEVKNSGIYVSFFERWNNGFLIYWKLTIDKVQMKPRNDNESHKKGRKNRCLWQSGLGPSHKNRNYLPCNHFLNTFYQAWRERHSIKDKK